MSVLSVENKTKSKEEFGTFLPVGIHCLFFRKKIIIEILVAPDEKECKNKEKVKR